MALRSIQLVRPNLKETALTVALNLGGSLSLEKYFFSTEMMCQLIMVAVLWCTSLQPSRPLVVVGGTGSRTGRIFRIGPVTPDCCSGGLKGKRSVYEYTCDSQRWVSSLVGQISHNLEFSTHYVLLFSRCCCPPSPFTECVIGNSIDSNCLSVHGKLNFMLSLTIIFTAQMSYQISVPPLLATLNKKKR